MLCKLSFRPFPINKLNFSTKKSTSLGVTIMLYPIGVKTSNNNCFISLSSKVPTIPNNVYLSFLFNVIFSFR